MRPGQSSGSYLPGAVSEPRGGPSGRGHVITTVLRALRPKQWTKNLLVFVAPAAAQGLKHETTFLRALGAFGILCAAASGLYLLNDVKDSSADWLHPVKRHRPVASGALDSRVATGVGFGLLAVALSLSWVLAGWVLTTVIGVYIAISVSYTLRLKKEPVIELACVASGFVLRAIAGGAATHVPLSSWFLVVASFGALFIVIGKRVAEYHTLGDGRAVHRPVLDAYTPTFLRSALTLSASVAVTAYCLWAFERAGLIGRAGHHYVWIQLTVIPIVLGLLHVLRLLDAGKGGSPEDLVIHDRLLQVLGLLWVVLFGIGLYG